MLFRFSLPAILLLSFIFSSCKKDHSSLPCRKIESGTQTTLRDISIINDSTWIICGGDQNGGIILRTFNKGTGWEQLPAFENSVNALYFLNEETGFAADADILIYRTDNGGKNWNLFYATSWPLTVNRNLRDIWFTSDSTGFVCGGKNLGNGVLYETSNSGNYWNFREFTHEYRGICFSDAMNGVMCGYSSLLVTSNGGASFESAGDHKGYFTGITFDAYGQYWVCDFNGMVISSSDKGRRWNEKRKGGSFNVTSDHLNCVAVSPSGRVACAGFDGFLTWSDDQGETWNDRCSFQGNEIMRLRWLNDAEIIAVGKKGGIYVVNL